MDNFGAGFPGFIRLSDCKFSIHFICNIVRQQMKILDTFKSRIVISGVSISSSKCCILLAKEDSRFSEICGHEKCCLSS